MVELIVVFISADPDGQEYIFQSKIKIVGDYVIDALFVSADVRVDIFPDRRGHAVLGIFEAIFGVDLEEFGTESADILFVVVHELIQRPGFEAAGYFWRQGIAC